MKEHMDFFDRQASSWDEQCGDRAERILEVVSWFRIQPGDRLLDVGTGTGVLLPHLCEATESHGMVVAMDFSSKMLEKARMRPCAGGMFLLNAGVLQIPIRSGRFDRVTCFSAFPHFPDKEKALREMVRVLKNGGRLFIAHLHSSEEINLLHRKLGDVVVHDRLPEPARMRSMMSLAGLSEIQVVDEPGRFFAEGKKP